MNKMKKQQSPQRYFIQCPKCPEMNLITETTALLNGFSWWNCLKCGHKGERTEFIKERLLN